MSTQSETARIPQLRFPEFSEEWEEKRLEDVGSFKNGLNKPKEDFGFGWRDGNLHSSRRT